MIKRIGVVETRDDPALTSTISSPNELSLNATSSPVLTVDAKKKKKKPKTKRKTVPEKQQQSAALEQLTEPVEAFPQSRKISIP